MKFVVFILVLVLVGVLVFWGDIFGTREEGEGDPIVEENTVKVLPPEEEIPAPRARKNSVKELMEHGRWEEALEGLNAQPGGQNNLQRLAAKHLCLTRLERETEAEEVLSVILDQGAGTGLAVKAVLDSLEAGSHSKLEIRKKLSQVSDGFGSLEAGQVHRLVDKVKEINADIPGSIQNLFANETYTVVPNDCLYNICKAFNRRNAFNIQSGLVAWLNGIQGDRIYPGQTLTIPKEELVIKIWKKNWLMGIFMGDMLLCAYQVGLGKDSQSTPKGRFIIETRLENPDWNSAKHGRIIPFGDPENILGTRWLGFKDQSKARGLGIHGTVDPSSIGKNLSSGCIRLNNKDVEELFDVVARGTPVQVL